jgi:hypothetical protein
MNLKIDPPIADYDHWPAALQGNARVRKAGQQQSSDEKNQQSQLSSG